MRSKKTKTEESREWRVEVSNCNNNIEFCERKMRIMIESTTYNVAIWFCERYSKHGESQWEICFTHSNNRHINRISIYHFEIGKEEEKVSKRYKNGYFVDAKKVRVYNKPNESD